MKTLETFTANIYCGLCPGYRFGGYSIRVQRNRALNICQSYCDSIGLGLTFTRTRFVYTKGSEQGVIVGLINYPRFPKATAEIRGHAIGLAWQLLEGLEQQRVSIVFTDDTIMLEGDENNA